MNEKKKLLNLLKSYFSSKFYDKDNKRELYSWYDSLDVHSNISKEEISEIQIRVKNKLSESLSAEKRPKLFAIRKLRIPIAAAFLLFVTFGGYYAFKNLEREASVEILAQIVPKQEEAIIQLQNGEIINIDRLAINESVKINDIVITKNKSGNISYKNINTGKIVVQQNTLSVPKFSTYSITLTDGTKVTLNSESKLIYPSTFDENARIVELEGEGYFEVNKKANKSAFIVKSKLQEVKVLGTKFNIKSSNNTKEIRTSLIEGSVAVKTSNQQEVVLKPNQQALNVNEDLDVVPMDSEQVLSWMQNQFYFNGENSAEVLADIATWYDIDIVCKKNPQYKGVISRSLSLDKFIELLKYADMNVRALVGQGNKIKLIIT